MGLNIKQCPYCGDFFGEKLIEKHQQRCAKRTNTTTFQCKICNKIFESFKELENHTQQHTHEAVPN